MIDSLLAPRVFYPLVIALVVLVLTLVANTQLTVFWWKAIGVGVAILCIGLMIALASGVPVAKLLDVLLFEGGNTFGFRQIIALGYIAIFAGFALLCRRLLAPTNP